MPGRCKASTSELAGQRLNTFDERAWFTDQMLKERLNRIVIAALSTLEADVNERLGLNDVQPTVIYNSSKFEHGDFSSSFALTLASANSSYALPAAKAIAESIASSKDGKEIIEELWVVPPGYLNFRLRNSCLAEVFCLIHQKKHLYGKELLNDSQQALLSLWLKPALNNGTDHGASNLNTEMIGPTSRGDPTLFMHYVLNRCSSLLRLAQEETPNIHAARIDPPVFSKDEWQSLQESFATKFSVFAPAFAEPGQMPLLLRTLAVSLDAFPEELKQAVLTNDRRRLVRYAFEVASYLEEFRQAVRFRPEEKALLASQLGILAAGRQVLSNIFESIGT